MTAVWGPLGWMTLHSVATCYPETPTVAEKQLFITWLDLFRDTITCNNCKEHFTALLANYRASYPNMLDSRNDFALFSFRAHNAVNRRLHKPIYNSVAECLDTLKKNTQTRSAGEYRRAYIQHIHRYFRTLRDAAGIAALKKIVEMNKIDNDYITPRDTKFDVDIVDATVVMPYAVSTATPGEPIPRAAPIQSASLGRMRFTGGAFRIQR